MVSHRKAPLSTPNGSLFAGLIRKPFLALVIAVWLVAGALLVWDYAEMLNV